MKLWGQRCDGVTHKSDVAVGGFACNDEALADYEVCVWRAKAAPKPSLAGEFTKRRKPVEIRQVLRTFCCIARIAITNVSRIDRGSGRCHFTQVTLPQTHAKRTNQSASRVV